MYNAPQGGAKKLNKMEKIKFSIPKGIGISLLVVLFFTVIGNSFGSFGFWIGLIIGLWLGYSMFINSLYTKKTNMRAQLFLFGELLGEIQEDGLHYIFGKFISQMVHIKEYPKFEMNISIEEVVVTHKLKNEVTINPDGSISSVSVNNTTSEKAINIIALKGVELEFDIENINIFYRKTGGRIEMGENDIPIINPNAPWVKRLKAHLGSLLNSFGYYVGYEGWMQNSIFTEVEFSNWTSQLGISDSFSILLKEYGLKLIRVQIGDVDQDESINEAQMQSMLLAAEQDAIAKRTAFYESKGWSPKEAAKKASEDLQLSKKQITKNVNEFTGNKIDGWVAGAALKK